MRTWFVVLAVAAACGGTSSHTGVNPDKSLDELDVEELEQVCRALFLDDFGLSEVELRRWRCYTTGLALEQQFPNLFPCESVVADCLDHGNEPAETCVIGANDDLPACASAVTIGAIEDCLDEVSARAHHYANMVTCDTAPDLVLSLPPACAAIEAACPGILEE